MLIMLLRLHRERSVRFYATADVLVSLFISWLLPEVSNRREERVARFAVFFVALSAGPEELYKPDVTNRKLTDALQELIHQIPLVNL